MVWLHLLLFLLLLQLLPSTNTYTWLDMEEDEDDNGLSAFLPQIKVDRSMLVVGGAITVPQPLAAYQHGHHLCGSFGEMERQGIACVKSREEMHEVARQMVDEDVEMLKLAPPSSKLDELGGQKVRIEGVKRLMDVEGRSIVCVDVMSVWMCRMMIGGIEIVEVKVVGSTTTLMLCFKDEESSSCEWVMGKERMVWAKKKANIASDISWMMNQKFANDGQRSLTSADITEKSGLFHKRTTTIERFDDGSYKLQEKNKNRLTRSKSRTTMQVENRN